MLGELLIAAGPGEWRAALLEDGIPVELFVERGDRSEAGSIHLGRVHRLLPALGAMLVDIGADRPAFLPQNEVFPRGRRLDEGERVIVQIRREAQGGKAASVTTMVVLRGKLVELRSGGRGTVGGETLSSDERARLRAAVDGWTEEPSLQSSVGIKLLGSAPVDTLIAAITELLRRRADICQRASEFQPPMRLDPRATFAAALSSALPASPMRIFTDDPASIPELREAFPGVVAQHRSEPAVPIELDDTFDRALSRTFALDGGGWVNIEATRAGVMIDVDSGTPETGSPERAGLAVNLTAASAIARELRLRSIGGGIVIDFVGLDHRGLRERVRQALTEELAPDPACPQILGWTRLGHLELVRPRRRRPLSETLLEPRSGGPLVKTAITVAHEALRTLRREARAQPGRSWRLTIAPDVAAAFSGGAAAALRALEDRFGRKIAIEADPSTDRERFQITPI
jgi:Rne/Rng family ribonuclease